MNPEESKQSFQETPLSVFLKRLGVDSAAELARRLGCSESTIRNWGKGRSKQPQLTISQFKRFVKELDAAGIDLDEVPDSFSPKENQNA